MADDQDQKVVTANTFQLEDKEGRKLAELKVNSEGFPVLVLYNKLQKIRVVVGIGTDESQEFSSIALYDDSEEPIVGITVTADGEQSFMGFAEMVQRNRARQREEEKEE